MPVFYYCKNKFPLIYVWVTKHHRVVDSGTNQTHDDTYNQLKYAVMDAENMQ